MRTNQDKFFKFKFCPGSILEGIYFFPSHYSKNKTAMDFSKKKLDPYFIELTEDACLKAFNRRTALKKFIAHHGPEKFGISPYDCSSTKRVYLDDTFMELSSRNDAISHEFIYDLASSLVAMRSFPDLSGWDDSKDKIETAYRSCEKLRKEYAKISEVIEDEKAIAKRKALANKIKTSTEKSCRQFDEIKSKFELLLPSIGTQKGGYDFEKWFYQLVDYFEIANRRPYKDLNGRQIDGSITLHGITYLIELKFKEKPVGSEDIDIFLSKINRKAENTMGIMVSMSGFIPNAINNASRDRTPLLLLDYSHIVNIILQQIMKLDEVVDRVNRHASQTGCSFLPASEFYVP